MRRILLLVLVITGIISASSDISVYIKGKGTKGPYRLGYTHIITGSERIEFKGNQLTSGKDYYINYSDGFITLVDVLPQNDSIHITFLVLPLNLKPSYQMLKPVEFTENYITSDKPAVKSRSTGEQLEIIGSKGFVVNIGNRGDPAMSQSLDLNISGQMAKGVFVKGSITDQNAGGSSAGGTRSLDELDKIFLSLETKNFRGDFGDLELKGIDESLLDFNRKLTGLSLTGNTGSVKGVTSLAFSPGNQVELFFYGVDGKQGPYLLQSYDQRSTIPSGTVFLQGTEEVYLDSRKLTRGSENDYYIDYDNGCIEFNPKNIISSKSRITVKIQYAAENYRRSFYNLNSFHENNVSFGIQYIGEKDDKSSPRSFDLGETERAVLSQAGAIRDSAYSSGVKYVGDGNGDYVSLTDSLGYIYYVYTGAGVGDYQVSFNRAISGIGDYQYSGSGIYTYVGKGSGSYLPVTYYPLPERKDYGSLLIKKEGDFHFRCELAGSRADRNSLSETDGILTGTGILASIGLKKSDQEFFDRQWEANILKLKIRSIDNEFQFPGIIDPPEFFRRYNVPRLRSGVGERLFEIQSGAGSSQGDIINAGSGIFKSDDFDAQKFSGSFKLITFNRLALSASSEISKSDNKLTGQTSDWNKYEAGAKISQGFFQPRITVRHELNDGLNLNTVGFKADEYEGDINLFLTSGLSSNSKLLYREQKSLIQDSVVAGRWHNQYEQYQVEQGLRYNNPRTGFNGEINISRFYQKRFHPLNETLLRNMGNIKLNYSSPDVTVTFYENVNGTGRISRERSYVYVGDGNGDFRKDGDDYVPETGGDYIEVIRQLEETELAGYEVSGGLRVRLHGRIMSREGLLNRMIYENEFTHKTNLKSSTRLQLKYLVSLFDYSDDISYRTHVFNQRTTFRLNNQGDFVRHSLKTSKSRGTNFQFEYLDNRLLSNTADIKLFSKKTVSVLISSEYTLDKSALLSGGIDVRRLKTRFMPEFHPVSMLLIEIPVEYSNEVESNKDITISSYSAGVNTIINIRNYGRIEINGGYTRVSADRTGIFIPYKVANGKKQGDNFNSMVSARFKLNSYSRIELRYNYKRLGDGYSNSNLRLEAKAQF